jgi:hypothetical protein
VDERQSPGKRLSASATIGFGAALAACAGAVLGYLVKGTTRATLFGALGIAFFAGKNAVIMALNLSLPAALGVGAAGGFAGGLCLGDGLAAEPAGWLGGIAGAAIGVAEVLLGWWRGHVGRT